MTNPDLRMLFRIRNLIQDFQETTRQGRRIKMLACLNLIRILQALDHLAKDMVLIRMAMGIIEILKLERIKELAKEGVALVRIKTEIMKIRC
jgi:hypothetical protein